MVICSKPIKTLILSNQKFIHSSIKKSLMARQKIYHSFCDKYGKEYKFDDYLSFASFWYGMSRKTAKIYFPENFDKLQRAASDSKEARKRI